MTTWLQCRATRKKLWLAAAIVLSASAFSECALAQEKPVDASQLDIGGVRLYMSPDEALAALKNHYGAKIKLNVAKGKCQYNPSAQCVREITFADGVYEFSAKFAE